MAFVTLRMMVCDVLRGKLPSPAYTAEMGCAPTVNVVRVSIAVPVFRMEVPIWLVPSWKMTVPVGVPTAEVKVAVSVTVCANVAGWDSPPTAWWSPWIERLEWCSHRWPVGSNLPTRGTHR